MADKLDLVRPFDSDEGRAVRSPKASFNWVPIRDPFSYPEGMALDRSALFVDAGYLLAAGAMSCTGKPARADVECAYGLLVAALLQFVKSHSGLSLLRAYWYDGAPDALPTADQLKVARMADVKLRLGRLVGGRQKGVDSLIVRDLMTLARERAIATAYLLAGDEDLREGVVAAQDLGVRVVVLSFDPRFAVPANTLINESDEHVVLNADLWRPFFKTRAEQLVIAVEVSDSSAATLSSGAPASPTPASASSDAVDVRPFYEFGREYGARLAGATDPVAKEKVVQSAPRVPDHIDSDLLREAARQFGPIDGLEKKRSLRAGFWRGFRPSADQPEAPQTA